MPAVTDMGNSQFKIVNVSSIKAQTNTSNTNYERSLSLTAQDDTGAASALSLELKSAVPSISTSQRQLHFTLPTRIKKVATSVGANDLVPKNEIDGTVDAPSFFTGFPYRLITPMQLGWSAIGGGNTYTGVLDSGVCYSTSALGQTQNMFLCDKVIPATAGTKVYIELEVLYQGDNDGDTRVSLNTPIIPGIVNEAAWNGTDSSNGTWPLNITAKKDGCCAVMGKDWNPTGYNLYNKNGVDSSWNAAKINGTSGFVEEVINYFRSGLKVQVAYDVDGDNIEVVMFEGPKGDGLAHGTRLRCIFTAATGGTFSASPSYFMIIVNNTTYQPAIHSLKILPQLAISKNKIGYYLGDMTGVVELV